jgi:hypothetical protein
MVLIETIGSFHNAAAAVVSSRVIGGRTMNGGENFRFGQSARIHSAWAAVPPVC